MPPNLPQPPSAPSSLAQASSCRRCRQRRAPSSLACRRARAPSRRPAPSAMRPTAMCVPPSVVSCSPLLPLLIPHFLVPCTPCALPCGTAFVSMVLLPHSSHAQSDAAAHACAARRGAPALKPCPLLPGLRSICSGGRRTCAPPHPPGLPGAAAHVCNAHAFRGASLRALHAQRLLVRAA